MYATWEDRYKNIIAAPAHETNVAESGGTICQNSCTFTIAYPENEKDYIKGMYVQTSDDVLHIDPTVDTTQVAMVTTKSKRTKPEEKSIFMFNGSATNGLVQDKYELIDIFFQSPSRVMMQHNSVNKRYPMEVCLVHQSIDSGQKRFLVICCMLVPASNITTDLEKQGKLYEMLTILGNNFPDKNSSESVSSVSSWSPRVFLPPVDKRAFFYWLDIQVNPKSSGSVLYLAFEYPQIIPDSFYNNFISLIPNGMTGQQAQMNAPFPKPPPPLHYFFNAMEPVETVQTQWQCKAVGDVNTNKYFLSMEELRREAADKKEIRVPKAPSTKGLSGKVIAIIVILVTLVCIVGGVIMIRWRAPVWYNKHIGKYFGNSQLFGVSS